jgi:autotransporter-associated beta strand protein
MTSNIYTGNQSADFSTIVNSGNGNYTAFYNNSTAGNATIVDDGAPSFGDTNGDTSFHDFTSAGSASITNVKLPSNAYGGYLVFYDNSTGGSALITTGDNSFTYFFNNSQPGNATLQAAGSGIYDFSYSSGPGGTHRLGVGSLAGSGFFYLGANTLVLSSGQSVVTGSIRDGGQNGGAGGGIEATSGSRLILSGTNTYTGTTRIDAGGIIQIGGDAFGNSGTTGSVANGDIVDNGNLIFDRSDAIALSNSISGSGAITQDGPGTLTLSGAASSFYGPDYSGVINVNHGIVDLAFPYERAHVSFGTQASGTLIIEHPSYLFTSHSSSFMVLANYTIDNFAQGDTIDVRTIGTPARATLDSSNDLQLFDSQNREVAHLTLTGDFSHSRFLLSPDRQGGTSIQVANVITSSSYTLPFRLTEATVGYRDGLVAISGQAGQTYYFSGTTTFQFTDGAVTENTGADAFVDNLYYYSRNHDVWASYLNGGTDATTHYNGNGWHEGRDPNADFSTTGYLGANPDVAAAGANPLQHYEQFGWREGRDPSANFDDELYLARNPDVAAAGLNPLQHYLDNGEAEGRQTYAVVGRASDLAPHPGFDPEYYLLSNPDVARAALAAGGNTFNFAYNHYETYGWHEGRDPDANFDVREYFSAYPDVANAGIDPLQHYTANGWQEGRDPSGNFDTLQYESHYGDVASAHLDPLQHYLQFGAREGRSAFPDGIFHGAA